MPNYFNFREHLVYLIVFSYSVNRKYKFQNWYLKNNGTYHIFARVKIIKNWQAIQKKIHMVFKLYDQKYAPTTRTSPTSLHWHGNLIFFLVVHPFVALTYVKFHIHMSSFFEIFHSTFKFSYILKMYLKMYDFWLLMTDKRIKNELIHQVSIGKSFKDECDGIHQNGF